MRRQFAAHPDEAPDERAAATSATPVTLETGVSEAAAEALPLSADAGEQLAQWPALVAAHLADEYFGPAELAGLLNLTAHAGRHCPPSNFC